MHDGVPSLWCQARWKGPVAIMSALVWGTPPKRRPHRIFHFKGGECLEPFAMPDPDSEALGDDDIWP